MVLGRYMQKNETRPPLIPHTRINSQWIKELNVRPKTTELLEENTGNKISNIAHGNILSDISPTVLRTPVFVGLEPHLRRAVESSPCVKTSNWKAGDGISEEDPWKAPVLPHQARDRWESVNKQNINFVIYETSVRERSLVKPQTVWCTIYTLV